MSQEPNVIEIDGKRYDAITGKVIGAVKRIAQPAASGSIDGIAKVKHRIIKNRPKQPASQVHKRAQKGKTLMRRAVKQPAALKNFSKIIPAKSIETINPGRLARLSSIRRSPKISHYSSAAAAKAKAPAQSENSTLRANNSSAGGSSLALAKPLPSLVTSVSHQKLERMLDEALAKADAHKQMLNQLKKRSWWRKLNFLPAWVTVSTVVLLALIAGGVFAWQKIPQVSLKLADSKAKISASVPAYQPDGFAIKGPVKYQSGAVVVNYGAGGNQQYSLIQKASDWDSVSLEANAIPSNTPVQTSQVKGTTVYIYGDDNDATWVSNGIRYTLKDKANLSSDQIIKIADSL